MMGVMATTLCLRRSAHKKSSLTISARGKLIRIIFICCHKVSQFIRQLVAGEFAE